MLFLHCKPREVQVEGPGSLQRQPLRCGPRRVGPLSHQTERGLSTRHLAHQGADSRPGQPSREVHQTGISPNSIRHSKPHQPRYEASPDEKSQAGHILMHSVSRCIVLV